MKILLLLLVFLSSCDFRQTDRDVGEQAEYQGAIGARYEVVADLKAYGIREHSAAPVDYITLIPPPGIAGPEVGFDVPVRAGSTVTVLKVVRTNRVFDPMTFIVRLDGTPMPASVPVRLDLSRGNEGKRDLELNPAIYRQIPSS